MAFFMRDLLFERRESNLLRVSRGQRLEILSDAGLGGISDGEGGHAAVTHPKHHRPERVRIIICFVLPPDMADKCILYTVCSSLFVQGGFVRFER